jgi:hypothetical protein
MLRAGGGFDSGLGRHVPVGERLIMRTLTEKYLGGLALGEDIYKIDLAVLDRYQSFSSELLRLSLLGIAGYGFLIGNLVFKITSGNGQFVLLASFTQSRIILSVGAIALALTAITALGHRYFSTDCITHYVRRLRLIKRHVDISDDGSQESEVERKKLSGIISTEERSLRKDLLWCKWLLAASSLFLLLGAVCVAWAFASILFTLPADNSFNPTAR